MTQRSGIDSRFNHAATSLAVFHDALELLTSAGARRAAEVAVVLDLLDFDRVKEENFSLHIDTGCSFRIQPEPRNGGQPWVFRLNEAELKRQFWNENLPAMVVSL